MKILVREFLSSFFAVPDSYLARSTGNLARLRDLTKVLTDGMAGSVSKELAERIVKYAPLHDIGKRLVPEHIIEKPGPLTLAEYEIMKIHTVKGAEYLREFILFPSEEDLRIATEIAEFHHERYDGSGYPHGLKGKEIPLPARIVALADVYDALRSPRPYKNAFSHEEATRIILQGDDRTRPEHFDPKVLKVFKAFSDTFEQIYAGAEACEVY